MTFISSYTLGQIALVQQGYTFKPEYQGQSAGKWVYAKVADLSASGSSKYLRQSINYISDTVLNAMGAKPFSAGSIVFPRVGAALRNNNKRLLAQDSLTDDNVFVITVRNVDLCSPEYLYYWFDFHDLQKFCNDGTVPVINGKNLKRQRVLLPNIQIQRKTAEMIDAWDAGIEKIAQLIAAKEYFLAGIRQDFFGKNSGVQTRDWKSVHLSEVLTEHRRKCTGTESVFSVSVHKGLINQIEHLGRSYAATDTSNYNRVQLGDIVYTKSPTGDFPFGIVKQSHVKVDVIVSPLYGVFSPVTPELGLLIDFYFESPTYAKNYLGPLIQKGAKNTMSITNSGFLSGKLNLPLTIGEQKRIAQFITEARKEIALLHLMKASYDDQKRGLMQKLLTGQWRVPTTTHEKQGATTC